MSQLGCVDSETNYRKKEGPWIQVQGISLGPTAAAYCFPGYKSHGNPFCLGERMQRYMTKERSEGKVLVCSKESVYWVLCLKGSYLFSKGGNFRDHSQGSFSIEYSSAFQLCPLIRRLIKMSL